MLPDRMPDLSAVDSVELRVTAGAAQKTNSRFTSKPGTDGAEASNAARLS